MNTNIRRFASDVEDRLEKAYKAGSYNKKFGYEGLNTKNMDDDVETKSVLSAGGSKMTTFDKILHKDNKKLNRMQAQAKSYL